MNQLDETELLPDEFWLGVKQFNQGEFYACHDTLEAIWMESIEPQRTFYQGILQIAVGLYHLSNHNWRGTATLLGEGINRLRRYPSVFAAVDVDHLLIQSTELLAAIQQAGPERVAEIAQQLAQTSADAQEGAIASLIPVILTVP